MGDIITTFHIDWHLMLAQLINFAIVAFVLWRFAVKPLLKVMTARSKEIQQSLEQAKQIEQELKGMDDKKAEAEVEAKRRAQIIVDEAMQEAGKRRQEILEQVRVEAAEAVTSARRQMEAEREVAVGDLRREAARLVTLAVTRVFGKLKVSDIDKELVNEVVDDLGKRKK